MWIAFGFSLLLIIITIFMHFEAMSWISRLLPRDKVPPGPMVMVVMLGITLAHVAEILIYAVAYLLLTGRFGLGGFSEQFESTFTNFFYFSAVSYTTVGLSSFYATGNLKIIAALEALNGFVLITWSASFGYSALGQFWKRDS